MMPIFPDPLHIESVGQMIPKLQIRKDRNGARKMKYFQHANFVPCEIDIFDHTVLKHQSLLAKR